MKANIRLGNHWNAILETDNEKYPSTLTLFWSCFKAGRTLLPHLRWKL